MTVYIQSNFALINFLGAGWLCLGAVWRARNLGEKPRYLQRWYPVHSQRQQVSTCPLLRATPTLRYDFIRMKVVLNHRLSSALTSCRLDFIYDLFERVGSRNGDETLKMGTARRKPTVSSQFRVRLEHLWWENVTTVWSCHHTEKELIVPLCCCA